MSTYDDVPEPLRSRLRTLATALTKKRVGTEATTEQLADLCVAYTAEGCGCAHVPRAVQPWLHANHAAYSAMVLALLPQDLRIKLFHHTEGVSASPTNGPRGAEAIRRIQDWLLPYVPTPTRHTKGGGRPKNREGTAP